MCYTIIQQLSGKSKHSVGVIAMSFLSFSKEFSANMFTAVENQFITKYVPQADGDAVRVYLYGLYLCSCKDEFDGQALAKLLKLPYERLKEIFAFWEECDLVHILSREPLLVEYLPVNASVGKPKPIRPEKYAEFNRELLHQLQRAGKDFKPYEMMRILEFLENNPMEQQAFLLISEYCVRKDGEKVSCAHILNKAKKLCAEHKYTYEQVEQELNDFNTHEREVSKIFSLLGIYRRPQESDYVYPDRWAQLGMEPAAIYACAQTMKKGTLSSLDALVTELAERGIFTAAAAKEYLAHREELAAIVFRVAAKLSVKIQNPRAYIENYAEKWADRGFDAESLTTLAKLCFKLGYGFEKMDDLVDSLFARGITDESEVAAYVRRQEKLISLLSSLQRDCDRLKRTQNTLDMLEAWKGAGYGDDLLHAAAERAAAASAPLPYMNKLLSEWRREGIQHAADIPQSAPQGQAQRTDFRSSREIAADEKSDREHYYSVLRNRAIGAAEEAKRRAEQDPVYKRAEGEIKKGEIELARAELFDAESVPTIRAKLEKLHAERRAALARMQLSEEDLIPHFQCEKCSDTGFLPNGRACDCYHPAQQETK